jgi:hypothetical protein
MEKFCKLCGETKPVSDFHKDKSRIDGLQFYCKPCTLAKQARIQLTKPRRRDLAAPEGKKWCHDCKAYFPVEDFHANATQFGGRQIMCKSCNLKRSRHWREGHREAWNDYHRDHRAKHQERYQEYERRRRYGMAAGDYAAMLEAQGGRCAICRTDTPGGKGTFHVDHCHDSGNVRGLLCGDCNLGIGKFKHDANILTLAIQYLSRRL